MNAFLIMKISQYIVLHSSCIDVYRKLIAVINEWLSGNYEQSDPNAPSWWKIVDVVADEIGGQNPALAQNIAKEWKG